MPEEQQRYLSYLLRLWRSEAVGQSIWRASLEDPHTGERRNFASIEHLFAFLEEQTGGRRSAGPWQSDET
jgi:hypothetical protein